MNKISSFCLGMFAALSVLSTQVIAQEPRDDAAELKAFESTLTPEQKKAWEAHWDGVAKAFVGGMGQLAKKGLNSVVKDVGETLTEIRVILNEPIYKPNTWQKYSDGYLRTYSNGRWYVLVNGKVIPN